MSSSEVPGRRGPPPATSVVVWGSDRSSVNRVALSVARGLAPRYYWLEVETSDSAGRPPVPPAQASGEPSGTSSAIAPEALKPDWALGNARRWTVVVEPTGSAEVAALETHARLPDLVRRIIEQHGPANDPATLLVTNVDLGADKLYPEAPGTFSRGIGALNGAGISLVLTMARPPRPNMEDMAHELRVDPGRSSGGATITCLRSRDAPVPPFAPGRSWSLSDFETALRGPSSRSTERAT